MHKGSPVINYVFKKSNPVVNLKKEYLPEKTLLVLIFCFFTQEQQSVVPRKD